MKKSVIAGIVLVISILVFALTFTEAIFLTQLGYPNTKNYDEVFMEDVLDTPYNTLGSSISTYFERDTLQNAKYNEELTKIRHSLSITDENGTEMLKNNIFDSEIQYENTVQCRFYKVVTVDEDGNITGSFIDIRDDYYGSTYLADGYLVDKYSSVDIKNDENLSFNASEILSKSPNNALTERSDANGNTYYKYYDEDTGVEYSFYSNEVPSEVSSHISITTTSTYEKELGTITLRSVYIEDASIKDGFDQLLWLVNVFEATAPFNLFLVIISLILGLISFFALIYFAGKENGKLHLTFIDKMPSELFALAVGLIATIFIIASTLSFAAYSGTTYMGHLYYNIYPYIIAPISAIICTILVVITLYTFVVRIKAKTFFKNTLTYKFFAFFFGKPLIFIKDMFSEIPLVFKTFLITLGYILFTCFLAMLWGSGNAIVIFAMERLFILPVVLLIALFLKRLKDGAREISKGNLDYKIDTKYMFFDFKDHANDLNTIRDGLNVAVNDKIKSENLKTELITNVSHDLKTPLTSIINYVDLLSKEQTDNENIKEYTEVLERQSAKLKKLISDLLDISKANSKNINLELEKLNVNTFISQVTGDFSEKFDERNLTLITNISDENIEVSADGKLLWRVFDNIFTNALLYAMPNTRVYLDVLKNNTNVEFLLKNISSEPLNISENELFERFVRGDSSRNTEGSGLGLSIAKGLIEAQNGEMNLTIDGDFFKVSIKIPY